MSEEREESGFTERVAERPALAPDRVREVRPRDLGIRFAAGALTSAVSGAVTLWLGARIGGAFLAFPAILAASLTLIEEQEDSAEAREDARGAIVGAGALAVFATVVAVLVPDLRGWALAIASVAWTAVALGTYRLLWFR